ncbi:MAG: hypothetical protein HKN36_04005 [Hellea sp.]|nr:hypothetical protein [Hellea sp.]
MAKLDNIKPLWPRRIVMALVVAVLFLLALYVAARLFMRSSWGHNYVQSKIEAMSPLGQSIRLTHIDGDLLGDFQLDQIEISDGRGVWAIAHNVSVDWSPAALLNGTLAVNDLKIQSADIFRQPDLVETAGGSNNRIKRYNVDNFDVPALTLREFFAVQTMAIRASGKVRHGPGGGLLALKAQSNGSQVLDLADIDLTWSPDSLLMGAADITAKPGGLIKSALGFQGPETLRAKLGTQGIERDLKTDISARLGARDLLTGDIVKSGDIFTINARAEPGLFPQFAPIAGYLGGETNIVATYDSQDRDRRVRGSIRAPKVGAAFTAMAVDGGYAFPQFDFTLQKPFENQPDSPIFVETVTLSGEGAYSETFEFTGRVEASDLRYGKYRVESIAGPAKLALDQDIFLFDAKLIGAVGASEPLARWTADQPQIDLVGRYSLEDRNFLFSSADIRMPGLTLRGSGDSSLNRKTSQFSGNFQLGKGTLLDSLPADLSGKFTLNINQGKLGFTANGNAGNFDILPRPVPQLAGPSVSFSTSGDVENGNGINFRNFTATGDRLQVRGNVRYNFDSTFKAGLSYQTGEFTIGQVTVETADGTAQLSGRADDFTIDSAGTSPAMTIRDYTAENVEYSIKGVYRNGGFLGDINAAGTSKGEAVLVDVSLAYQQGDWQVERGRFDFGNLNVAGSLSGEQSDLSTLTGQLKLSGDPSLYLPAGAIDLDINLTGSSVDIGGSISDIAMGPLTDGTLTISAKGPREAVSYDLQFDSNSRIASVDRPLRLDLSGLADLTPDLNSSAATTSLNVKGNLGDYRFESQSPVMLSRTSGGIAARGDVEVFGGQLSFHLDPASDALVIGVSNLRVANIMNLRGQAGLEGRVSANAEFTLKGSGFDLRATGKIIGARQPGSDSEPLDLSFSAQIIDNVLSANAASLSESLTGDATIKGVVTTLASAPFIVWPLAEPLSGKIQFRGEVGSAAELFLPPATQIDGLLNVDLLYTLPIEENGVTGSLSLTGGAVEQGDMGLILNQLSARATFSGRTIRLQNLSATGPKGGTLTGGGEMDIGFEDGSAVQLSANNIRLVDRREGYAAVSGALELRHDGGRLKLGGDLIVDDANVDIDRFSPNKRPTLDVDFSGAQEPTFEPERRSTELNIGITSPSRIKLTGRGVDASMSLDMRVTGAFYDPQLSGEAIVTRGKFNFLGKPFVLDESQVDFRDEIMQSRLDVVAIRETSDLTATVNVVGTLERPEIRLSSVPTLPDDEIVSRILFGRSASQLTTIETARLAAALAQLSGGGGFDLLGGIENALGLDTLDFGQSDTGQTQLTTGKYLSDNVYVEVRGSAEGTPGLAIEWTPRSNIAVEAETAPGETQRVSVQWQKDFD